MKMLSSLILTLCLFSVLATVSASEVLEYCDQQLVQASVSCADSETLESCIMIALQGADCKLEIATEDEVDICNESCAPDIRLDLASSEN